MIFITFYEWILEMVLGFFMLINVKLINGRSHVLDRINIIAFNFSMFSILPLFHLMGDNYYRTLVLEHGYVKALWMRMIDLEN